MRPGNVCQYFCNSWREMVVVLTLDMIVDEGWG